MGTETASIHRDAQGLGADGGDSAKPHGSRRSHGSQGPRGSHEFRGPRASDGLRGQSGTPGTLSKSAVALVAGLTFWWPFYRKFEYSALFSLHADPAVDMWTPYTPIMLLLFAALLLGAAFHERVERALRDHRLAGCLVSATASLGWLLVYASPLVGSALPQGRAVVETIGCVLSAVGYAALTLGWGASLVKTPARRTAAALSVAIVLSTLTQLTAFLPGSGVMLAVAILSPTVSAVCWFAYGIPVTTTATDSKPSASSTSANLTPVGPAPATARRSMPLGALIMLGVFLIAGRVGVGLLSYSTESIPGTDRLMTIGFTVLLTVCLIAAAARVKDWGHLFQLAWSALAVVFMAAMFMLLADNATLDHIATATLSAVLTCFELALFVILAMSSYLSGTSGALAFGLASALFRVLPHYIGKTLAPLLMNADAGWAEQVTSFVIPIMLFMLVVATIVFMNARIMGKVRWLEGDDAEGGGLAPGQAGQAAKGAADGTRPAGGTGGAGAIGSGTGERERVDALAAKAGLTPRETDVLLLVSEGRSYQRIADTLNISLGTVQGHVKCIYRKLDVHTKQEIIELVRAR